MKSNKKLMLLFLALGFFFIAVNIISNTSNTNNIRIKFKRTKYYPPKSHGLTITKILFISMRVRRALVRRIGRGLGVKIGVKKETVPTEIPILLKMSL